MCGEDSAPLLAIHTGAFRGRGGGLGRTLTTPHPHPVEKRPCAHARPGASFPCFSRGAPSCPQQDSSFTCTRSLNPQAGPTHLAPPASRQPLPSSAGLCPNLEPPRSTEGTVPPPPNRLHRSACPAPGRPRGSVPHLREQGVEAFPAVHIQDGQPELPPRGRVEGAACERTGPSPRQRGSSRRKSGSLGRAGLQRPGGTDSLPSTSVWSPCPGKEHRRGASWEGAGPGAHGLGAGSLSLPGAHHPSAPTLAPPTPQTGPNCGCGDTPAALVPSTEKRPGPASRGGVSPNPGVQKSGRLRATRAVRPEARPPRPGAESSLGT